MRICLGTSKVRESELQKEVSSIQKQWMQNCWRVWPSGATPVSTLPEPVVGPWGVTKAAPLFYRCEIRIKGQGHENIDSLIH